MPPAQVQELVSEVKAWYETHKHDTRPRDLAAKLGVSPTGLCQIFAGANQPSAASALAMIRFLEENQSMKTDYLDPRTTPRQAAGNPGPKTLTEARQRIEALEAQLLQLRGSPATPKPGVKTAEPKTRLAQLQAQSAAMPRNTGLIFNEPNLQDQAPFNPEKDLPGWERVQSDPAPPPKLLPKSANTPVLIQKILDVTTLADLSSMLGNAEHSKLQLACIYAETRSRRAITSDPE